MRKLLLMLMSVVFLFAASAAVPIENDVGYGIETELIFSEMNQDIIGDVINFCQRTDAQATSEVTLMYALTDELIFPFSSETINVIQIRETNNTKCQVLILAVVENAEKYVYYDVGIISNPNFNSVKTENFT